MRNTKLPVNRNYRTIRILCPPYAWPYEGSYCNQVIAGVALCITFRNLSDVSIFWMLTPFKRKLSEAWGYLAYPERRPLDGRVMSLILVYFSSMYLGMSNRTSTPAFLASATISLSCTTSAAASSRSSRGTMRSPDSAISLRASFTFVPWSRT